MKNCRACGTALVQPFLSLGNSPFSNAYLSEEDLGRMEPYYPLDLYLCPGCFLVQLDQFQPAEAIFSNSYAYYSSYSESWLKHCREYTGMMIKRFGYDSGSLVVEIASNDGYLLQYFKGKGIPVLGIEPTANTAAVALDKGIPTEVCFFNVPWAQHFVQEGRMADLLIGNNVLAHNPDLNDFVAGMKLALKPGGVSTLEFPHLLRLMEHNQYDTIYHEHFSYFSLLSAVRLLASHGLTIFDVEELSTHGGSLRIFAAHQGNQTHAVSKRVQAVLDEEEKFGLRDPEVYRNFSGKVYKNKRELLAFLIAAKNQGRRIVGYGAPAKGNTLLNYCGIRTDYLDYTVDRSPHKQNKYLPGSHIPVFHPDRIRQDRPDYVLILPWNIRDEVISQLSYIREWGGRFVVPIPNVEVI